MKRTLSLLLAGIAYVAVPVWAYWQGQMLSSAQAKAHQAYVCGLPVLGILLAAIAMSGLIAALALIPGVLAYRKLPRPRGVMRVLELVVVGLPALLALVVVVGMAVTGG